MIPYENSFASHPKSKDWSLKNILKPEEVSICSSKIFIFNCHKCNHEFQKSINTFKIKGCIYCAGQKLCDNKECKICESKSFAANPRSIFWNKDNIGLPRDYFMSTALKFLFDCNKCNHVYKLSLNDISSKNTNCYYCSNRHLCDDDNCKMCEDKSFINSAYAKFWSPINNCTPRQVSKFSSKKFIFDCTKCNHSFIKPIYNISMIGSFCPYCANQRLCDDIDCTYCYNKSFATVEQSKYWSKKNKVLPRDCFKCSNKKYIFDCPECNNDYIGILSFITRCGIWCKCKNNKTESKLLAFLQLIFSNDVECQKKFDWCKNIRYLPFDYCIEIYKIIIELDGEQHFRNIRGWCDLEEIEKNDKYKMDLANKNGYSVIRIYQPDVWNNKNNWKDKLKTAIKKYDTITNIFIGDVYKTANIAKQNEI